MRGIIIDPEYIYIRESDFDTELLYIPVYNTDYMPEENIERLKNFFMDFVINSRIDTTGDNFIQQLIDVLNDGALTEKTLREFVSKNKRGTASEQRKSMESRTGERRRDDARQARPLGSAVQGQTPSRPAHAEIPGGKSAVRPAVNFAKKNAEAQQPKMAEKNTQDAKKKKGSSKSAVVFALLNAAIILAVAVCYQQGIFMTNGTLNVQILCAVLLIAAGLDFVVYRELFINSKNKKEKDSNKEKKNSLNAKKSPFDNREAFESDPSAAQKPVNRKKQKPENIPAKPAPPKRQQPAPYAAAVYEQDDDDSTVVMDAQEGDNIPYLEYYDNGLVNKIFLRKNNTVVGKQKSRVDYSIASDKVSKVHAEFIVNGDRYYVMDYNSTNGTRINGGGRIQPNSEFEIFDGDVIKIADVEMIFYRG